jgi:hypothetical protein
MSPAAWLVSRFSMRPVSLSNYSASPEANSENRNLPFQGSVYYWPARILGVINPM